MFYENNYYICIIHPCPHTRTEGAEKKKKTINQLKNKTL